MITSARSKIHLAYEAAKSRLEYRSMTIEVAIDKETDLFIDIICLKEELYHRIEIESIDVVRSSSKTKFYDNIADYIAKRLDIDILQFNAWEIKEVDDWEYQRQYETEGNYL